MATLTKRAQHRKAALASLQQRSDDLRLCLALSVALNRSHRLLRAILARSDGSIYATDQKTGQTFHALIEAELAKPVHILG